MLLRKSTAFYLFLASLLGVIVTMVHTVSVDYDFSVGEMVVFILMPLLVAAFLVWYSKYAERKGWLITQQMFNLK
jgi:Ca2+/Na+ antiporter